MQRIVEHLHKSCRNKVHNVTNMMCAKTSKGPRHHSVTGLEKLWILCLRQFLKVLDIMVAKSWKVVSITHETTSTSYIHSNCRAFKKLWLLCSRRPLRVIDIKVEKGSKIFDYYIWGNLAKSLDIMAKYGSKSSRYNY
jgi:hypothetical protein